MTDAIKSDKPECPTCIAHHCDECPHEDVGEKQKVGPSAVLVGYNRAAEKLEALVGRKTLTTTINTVDDEPFILAHDEPFTDGELSALKAITGCELRAYMNLYGFAAVPIT